MPIRRWQRALLLTTAVLWPCLQTALPQSEKPNLAFKYVAEGSDIKRLHGMGYAQELFRAMIPRPSLESLQRFFDSTLI